MEIETRIIAIHILPLYVGVRRKFGESWLQHSSMEEGKHWECDAPGRSNATVPHLHISRPTSLPLEMDYAAIIFDLEAHRGLRNNFHGLQ